MALKIGTIVLDSLAADPGSPADGEVWYNSTDGVGRIREDGVTGPLTGSTVGVEDRTATVNTTSTTDVAAGAGGGTDLSITPVAGTYFVFFSASVNNSAAAQDVFASIYVGGVQNAGSERRSDGSDIHPIASHAGVVVNGSQAIEVRWRVTGSTGSMYERTLMVLKVA